MMPSNSIIVPNKMIPLSTWYDIYKKPPDPSRVVKINNQLYVRLD